MILDSKCVQKRLFVRPLLLAEIATFVQGSHLFTLSLSSPLTKSNNSVVSSSSLPPFSSNEPKCILHPLPHPLVIRHHATFIRTNWKVVGFSSDQTLATPTPGIGTALIRIGFVVLLWFDLYLHMKFVRDFMHSLYESFSSKSGGGVGIPPLLLPPFQPLTVADCNPSVRKFDKQCESWGKFASKQAVSQVTILAILATLIQQDKHDESGVSWENKLG